MSDYAVAVLRSRLLSALRGSPEYPGDVQVRLPPPGANLSLLSLVNHLGEVYETFTVQSFPYEFYTPVPVAPFGSVLPDTWPNREEQWRMVGYASLTIDRIMWQNAPGKGPEVRIDLGLYRPFPFHDRCCMVCGVPGHRIPLPEGDVWIHTLRPEGWNLHDYQETT